MKLRDYQTRAVSSVLEKWKTKTSLLVVLPTGCGKTVVFGEIIRQMLLAHPGKRAMILAHREELIYQAQDKVGRISERSTGIEMGEQEVGDFFGDRAEVVVSTIQTQMTGRMRKFDPNDFALVVVDEAHHATSPSYRKVIDWYRQNPDCRVLGVTATPQRLDGQALGQIFDDTAYVYSVAEAIEDGWLVPIRQQLVKVSDIDYSKVKEVAGDFNQRQLAEVMEAEKALQAVAVPTVELTLDRRSIVFATSVKQAERLAEIIRRYDRTAAFISGETTKDDRHRILGEFREGKTQFLVNVGVLTEGFDDAGVSCVVMARPTKSDALYAQIIGRGMRPAAEIAGELGDATEVASTVDAASAASPASARRHMIAASTKPDCLVLDFVGNSGRHKLITSVDILGGDYSEKERERAKRKIEKGEETDPNEALKKSRAEIEAEKSESERKRSVITAQVKFETGLVNAFDYYDLPPVEKGMGGIVGPTAKTLSYKQQNIIRMNLRMDPAKMTASQGKALIDAYFRGIATHSASMAQTKFLVKNGVTYPMGFEEASRTIGMIRRSF